MNTVFSRVISYGTYRQRRTLPGFIYLKAFSFLRDFSQFFCYIPLSQTDLQSQYFTKGKKKKPSNREFIGFFNNSYNAEDGI
jgi:hypothetical protein